MGSSVIRREIRNGPQRVAVIQFRAKLDHAIDDGFPFLGGPGVSLNRGKGVAPGAAIADEGLCGLPRGTTPQGQRDEGERDKCQEGQASRCGGDLASAGRVLCGFSGRRVR